MNRRGLEKEVFVRLVRFKHSFEVVSMNASKQENEAYIATDDIEIGSENKILLWVSGLI